MTNKEFQEIQRCIGKIKEDFSRSEEIKEQIKKIKKKLEIHEVFFHFEIYLSHHHTFLTTLQYIFLD